MSEKDPNAPPPYAEAGGPEYPPANQQYPPAGQGYGPAPGGQGYGPAPGGQGYGQPMGGYPGGYAPPYGYTATTVMAPGPGGMMQASPPDHFCLAVFVTLCCFWPTGILAIMKASDARSAVARGDMNSAHNLSRSAKQMINISIGVGIASLILVGVIIGVYVGVFLNFRY